jgi:hypothetical protein
MNQLRLKNDRFKIKTLGNLPIIIEDSIVHTSTNEEKLKVVNLKPVGLRNIRIFTESCPINFPMHRL